jgi:N-acetylglucosaminyl-diphospho-decaprenol L-rhamnosyltransferase
MKLSVVIICWNDIKVILDCISSIHAETSEIDYEIVVTDNASSDGSVAAIRERFPTVRVVENPENGGFGKGNNAGIRVTEGEYVLILNPDTIVRDRALEKLVTYADLHPEAGAFGCRVLNTDGSVQLSVHPLPTIWTSLMKALGLRWPRRLWDGFCTDAYPGWDGRSERQIGFQAGCCLLARGRLLKELEGFDERFFHQFEDTDLCRRIWDSGRPVLFFPGAEITHIGGQNRGTYSIKVELEVERSNYRYFHKYYGVSGAVWIRYISILRLVGRYAVCQLLCGLRRDEILKSRLRKYEVLLKWHSGLDPIRFIETGAEPDVGYARLAAPANAVQNG